MSQEHKFEVLETAVACAKCGKATTVVFTGQLCSQCAKVWTDSKEKNWLPKSRSIRPHHYFIYGRDTGQRKRGSRAPALGYLEEIEVFRRRVDEHLPNAIPFARRMYERLNSDLKTDRITPEEAAVEMMMVLATDHECGEPAIATINHKGRTVLGCAWHEEQHRTLIAPLSVEN